MRKSAICAVLTTAVASLVGLSPLPSPEPSASAATVDHYRLETLALPDGSTRLARWNPCQTAITYRVNVAGVRGRTAKHSAVRVTKASVSRVARATGLPFRYAGRTRVVPRRANVAGQHVAELVVAFVRPRQTDFPLGGGSAAYGGWQSSYASTSNGDYRAAITRGYVVVDHPQTRHWVNGIHRGGVTRANLVTHELGHAVGLDHVRDRRQLMNATIRRTSPAGFGVGDRAGLARLGRRAGCITATWSVPDLS